MSFINRWRASEDTIDHYALIRRASEHRVDRTSMAWLFTQPVALTRRSIRWSKQARSILPASRLCRRWSASFAIAEKALRRSGMLKRLRGVVDGR